MDGGLDQVSYQYYYEKTKGFRVSINAILGREMSVQSLIRRDPAGAAYRKLALAEDMLNLASNYLILNSASLYLLRLKNYAALDLGRKAVFRGIGYLEELVTGYVDVPFSLYESKLRELELVEPERRYDLIRKMGLAVRLLENAYGEGERWRWVFVELEGRFAVVAKNIFDLKTAVVNSAPQSPHYAPSVRHLRLIKKLLQQAADRYRTRYELFSHETADFKKAVDFLMALRRIHILIGERDEAAMVRKKIDGWSMKMEADFRAKENVSPGS
jgi:hypothetical protein